MLLLPLEAGEIDAYYFERVFETLADGFWRDGSGSGRPSIVWV